jgi:hypothetical protein
MRLRRTAANQLDSRIKGDPRNCRRGSAEDWPGALTNFQKVLTSLEEHDTEQRAYVYFKLGCIKQAQGQPKQAINNFEKACPDRLTGPRSTRWSASTSREGLAAGRHYKRRSDNVFDGEAPSCSSTSATSGP